MKLEVNISNGFKSLTTLEPLKKGELIFAEEQVYTDIPDRLSVQVGMGSHLSVNDRTYIQYMNHSCDPSTYFVNEKLFALNDLSPGAHLTFNYNTTEYELSHPFQCHCGSANCIGMVRGFKFLTQEQRNAIKNICQPYLKDLFED